MLGSVRQSTSGTGALLNGETEHYGKAWRIGLMRWSGQIWSLHEFAADNYLTHESPLLELGYPQPS